VSANAPCGRRWRRQRTHRGHLVRSVPDPPARSRRRGVVSADCQAAQARGRRGVSSAQRRTPTRSLHANAHLGDGGHNGARHPASPLAGAFTAAWVLQHRSTAARQSAGQRRHRSRRFKNRSPPQLAPIHRRRVRAWFAHACQHAALPTAKHQPECAVTAGSDVANLRPPCRNLRLPCVANLTRGG